MGPAAERPPDAWRGLATVTYADVAGPEPVAGLWAVIGSLLVYTVFGSSRQLSVGPE